MEDNSKKWTKWTLIILTLPFLLIVLIIIVFFLIIISFAAVDNDITGSDGKIFSDQAGEMVNIVITAEEADRERFLHYQVVDIPPDSKERIAVRFNTEDEKNIGIIDEHGNVIKEPFLHDSLECYCGKYDPPLSLHINYGDYIDLAYFDGGIYNLELEPVTLSEQEMTKQEEYIHSKVTDEAVDFNVTAKEIVKIYEYFEYPKNYELRYLIRQGESGIYTAELIRPSGLTSSMFTLFLDENYDLASHFYYSPFDVDMLLPPTGGSKVGMVFVEDLGMVYFNLDGEIIWITYCDQTPPNHCEWVNQTSN